MDLLTNPAFLWLVAGVVLLVLEFAVPGVLLIFFSFGAFILVLLTWLLPGRLPIDLQLILFLVISLAALITLRRKLRRIFHGRKKADAADEDAADTGIQDELIGLRVTVTAPISPKSPGRVALNGTEWSAESADPCETGERVIITGRESLKLTVRRES